MIKATLFADTKCTLGEGSWFDRKTNKLYWLDVFGCKIFVHDFATNERKMYQLDKFVSTIVPKEDGTGFILGMRDGVYLTDNEFTQFTHIDIGEDFTDRRCNDGKCSPDGKMWMGVMQLYGAPGEGVQHVIGSDGSYIEQSGIDIPNGIVWNSTHDKVYFTDTLKAEIYEYDYADGHLSNKRVVYKVEEKCFTDGMTIDEDDNIWVAIHGLGRVLKIDPRKGELLDYVDVPALQTTSVAIANGKIYITSGSENMSEEEATNYPYSGGVFVADVSVNGVPAFYYKG